MDSGSTPVSEARDEYLRSVESGNYRRNAESILSDWESWLLRKRGVSSVDDVEVLDCRRYARYLKELAQGEDGLKPSTARTYYSVVRAFLGFCVDEEWISSNPAGVSRAKDELPEDTGDAERQFWRKEQREYLLGYVDERVRDVLDDEEDVERRQLVQRYRDRSLIYLLALSGVRGGEVLSDSNDEKRNGVTWSDLDLEQGTLRVFGKSREYEYAQVPKQAVDVLRRYKSVLEPPSEGFPVFPTGHGPSKYRAVREQLKEQGFSESEVEEILEENDVDDVVDDYEVVLPSLSKNGGRSILEKLCQEAEIDVDGDVLKLHGARRGLGHELYSKGHAELAQSALRHSSIEVTHESYSDIRASDTADRVGDVLDE